MPTTPNFNLVYPDSTGSTRLWEHFQALALSTDTAIEARAPADWTSFSPTMPGSTFGNATSVGQYIQLGKLVHAMMNVTFGTTTSVGTFLYVSLPVAAAAVVPTHVGSGIALGSIRSSLSVELESTLDKVLFVSAAGALVSATSPFTWGSGDIIRYSVTYQAA